MIQVVFPRLAHSSLTTTKSPHPPRHDIIKHLDDVSECSSQFLHHDYALYGEGKLSFIWRFYKINNIECKQEAKLADTSQWHSDTIIQRVSVQGTHSKSFLNELPPARDLQTFLVFSQHHA